VQILGELRPEHDAALVARSKGLALLDGLEQRERPDVLALGVEGDESRPVVPGGGGDHQVARDARDDAHDLRLLERDRGQALRLGDGPREGRRVEVPRVLERHVAPAHARREVDHLTPVRVAEAGEEPRERRTEGDRRQREERAPPVAPQVAPGHRSQVGSAHRRS
jgi:hypothetical protein